MSAMPVPRILLIPDRITDYRMWSDVPDRMTGRAEVVHIDQHCDLPWWSADESFLDQVRQLSAGDGFQAAAAAGQAARFGFAVAEAGLANGLVLFHPSLDAILDDVPVDLTDLDEILIPYQPLAELARDPSADVERFRAIIPQLVRQTAPADIPHDQLQISIAIFCDHAPEWLAELQAAAEAANAESPAPDPPWIDRPWIDRADQLTCPVTTVVTPREIDIARAIARRVANAETVLAGANPGLTTELERDKTARTILEHLDRMSHA